MGLITHIFTKGSVLRLRNTHSSVQLLIRICHVDEGDTCPPSSPTAATHSVAFPSMTYSAESL